MTGVPAGVGLGLRFAFLDEVLAGGVPPQIDFLELSPENYQRRGGFFAEAIEVLAERIPLSTHGLSLDLGGKDPLDPGYLADLRRLLDLLRVPWHSDHLCFARSAGRALHDLFPLPTDRATVTHVAERIRRARDALGRPIAVENISFYVRGPIGGRSDVGFVADVLEAADCGLLLDVNNVLVNAANHAFDPHDYIDALPLERVMAIHVAGGERLPRHPDHVIDTHGTDPSPAVLELLAYTLARTGTVPVLYERDHAIPTLDELVRQVVRIRAVVDAVRPPKPPLVDQRPPPLVIADLRDVIGPWVLAHRDRDEHPPPPLPGVDPADLEVYRNLVRTTMYGVVERFLPRTRAVVGDPTFEDAIAAWMDGPASVSPYLRDVPHELGEFLLARWAEEPQLARACDVLRYELLVPAVENTPQELTVTSEMAFSLDAPLRFVPSVRLIRFGHRVHEPFVGGLPAQGTTVLLTYRDLSGDARTLELTPLAEALVAALMAGETVERAIRLACRSTATALDDESLARVGTLLADLGGRGVFVS